MFADRKNKKFSWFKIVTSRLFVWVIKFLINENIVINTDVFRIMTKQVIDEVKRCKESNRYILGLVGWVGFKHVGVPVEQDERFKGITKYSMSKLVKLAKDAIFSFSDYPLRLITRIGFLLVLFSFTLGFYVIFKKIIYGVPVTGWASLITSIFFIGGIQIFMLGMIGEYLGRVYMEAKHRPLYVVRKLILGEGYAKRDNSTQ